MTAFIRQEALEKAREIQLKADEEFSIEKAQLVRSSTSQIDAEYEKKFKQAGMSQQITASTLANKTRLRLLSARQELLDDLFEQARKKLSDFSKDEKKYQGTVKNLLLEGLYALNENKVLVRCRKRDTELVKRAAEEAKKEYKQNMKKDVEVTVDEKERLPEDRSVLFSKTGMHLRRSTDTLTALAVSASSTEPARSTSTTLLKNASTCSRPTPCPVCGPRYSVRTRTGSSTTEQVLVKALS